MYTIYRTYTLYTIPYIHVDTSLLTDAIVDPLVAKSLNGTLAPTFSWIASKLPLIFAATFYSLLILDAKGNRKSQNICFTKSKFPGQHYWSNQADIDSGKRLFQGNSGWPTHHIWYSLGHLLSLWCPTLSDWRRGELGGRGEEIGIEMTQV